ncbi:MAG: T9SS type A sorting domain-containing protein [Salibacter sp.]|uniref:T9SS type A sorting domain-containing protein n=1 Tax=Salibacter sp. TaxID=2010995 RepID=UPI00286FF2ED|nr:T9SS type A sorting domain-containing protein [Salibacter sp.]MDR9399502.1 T9SS type A sorting domain-containing protein [Salibacter sp.]
MKNFIILLVLFGVTPIVFSQNYTSFFSGNTTDTTTTTYGGVCLMGGASEDDNAMIWFLQQANEGDVLVLRASGSDGYNDYMYSDLGVSVNSVETIVFNDSSAKNESYIHQKIQQAEAIWLAGGNQWNYVSYWRNSPIDSLINQAITNRDIVIGGTSAGMAVLGDFYFSAQNGTVTSSTALTNPFDNRIVVDSTSFISNDYLSDVITDTHYDNPDRKGRHIVFLSRILVDYRITAKGIACDEYTAVCIDTNGIARVYGDYPTYDDNAYFIQPNCEIINNEPENCSPGSPLDWNQNELAIKVYSVKGTTDGSNYFDLNDWESGNGGNWENWYVDNGVFNTQAGNKPNCKTLSTSPNDESSIFSVYPNPAANRVTISLQLNKYKSNSLVISNAIGQEFERLGLTGSDQIHLNTEDFPAGLYFIKIMRGGENILVEKLLIE